MQALSRETKTTVWLLDSKGSRIRGRVESVTPNALTLRVRGSILWTAPRDSIERARVRQSYSKRTVGRIDAAVSALVVFVVIPQVLSPDGGFSGW